jgi:ribosomal-protein-alanine N-acetyltransferase
VGGIEDVATARLVGRRVRHRDGDVAARLYGDPDVARTLRPAGVTGPFTRAESDAALARHVERWARDGFGPWLWTAEGEPIAIGGLARSDVGGEDAVEVLYAVVPAWWGRGVATEIARASVDVAWRLLGLTELVCFTLTTNHASRRAMEKAGFVVEREIEHAGLPHVFARWSSSAPRAHDGCA